MKTTKIKIGLLTAAIVPFLMACPKRKVEAPILDKELQSSIDVSFANLVITDIEMACAFVGENNDKVLFYSYAPGEDRSKFDVTNAGSGNEDKRVISYNSVRCNDGMTRDGSIILRYENDNLNANYYRNYNYHGTVRLESYEVNGWLVKLKEGTSCHIFNRLSSPTFNPLQTNLSWLLEGSFEFIHPTDASKNMSWTGTLIKTLTNTSDPKVYNPAGQKMIEWELARVEYRGNARGVTSGGVPYEMKINEARPLTRDFQCSPNPVAGIESIQPFKTWKEEYHPFKTGVVSFITGDKYPREIYYGNEGNPQLELQCDNSGEVLIKGVSNPVDFMK